MKLLTPWLLGLAALLGSPVAATALDGQPYRNSYAWFMVMRDGRIVSATAFFDSIAFDEFWRRVPPAAAAR